MNNKIKVIVTGATGMVGEGVVHQCLEHPSVEAVLVIGRKIAGVEHPKLKEILHQDFFDLRAIENELEGYDACFFCLGVSSVGMKEPEYYKLTYTLTMHVAGTLSRLNRDMVFCYVSGAGTDSTERGRSMWARVKGKTENNLMKLPFGKVFAFRPGYIHPLPGMKNTQPFYKYISWLYPFLKRIMPNSVSTLSQVSLAMINVVSYGYDKRILEVRDINTVAGL